MKIAILGPGAIGSLCAAILRKGGLDVTLVDHRAERSARLSKNGIILKSIHGEQQVVVPVTSDSRALGSVDLVLVCVKAHQTQAALLQHKGLLGSGTLIWSIQNGLGIVEVLQQFHPRCQLLGGCTTVGVFLEREGVLRHVGEGETFIGELGGGRSERVEGIARELCRAGMKVTVSGEIQRVMWEKIFVNVGINALTAILKVKNGAVLDREPVRRIMEQAVFEAVVAAGKNGVVFQEQEVLKKVRSVIQATKDNRSSMRVDLENDRLTEIEFLNGAIARMGCAPVNQTLADLVRALEVKA
jgi:2-dehydropantoate 2-reductase